MSTPIPAALLNCAECTEGDAPLQLIKRMRPGELGTAQRSEVSDVVDPTERTPAPANPKHVDTVTHAHMHAHTYLRT